MKVCTTPLFLLLFTISFTVISSDKEQNGESESMTETPMENNSMETEAKTEIPIQNVSEPVVVEVVSTTKKPKKSGSKSKNSNSSNATVIASKMSLKDMKIKELMAKLKKKAQERLQQEHKRKQQQKNQDKKEEESIVVEFKVPFQDPEQVRIMEEKRLEEEQKERERQEAERRREEERLEQERRKQEKREKEERIKNMKTRVVTEMMLLRIGVPVDYSYNQTKTRPDEIVSSPGCPQSIEGYPWVRYEKDNETKCYLVGQISSVCDGSSVMNYKRGSEFGVCACNFNECRSKYTKSEFKQFQKVRYGYSATSRYRFCRPPNVHCEQFVYDKKENQCFILYSQGPCKENEWLQLDGKGGLECAPRLCSEGKSLDDRSERDQIMFRNLTKEATTCCKSWGSYSVINLMEKRSCRGGGEEFYSEILGKCLVPFEDAGLIVG